jgi:hypothetical protein
MGSMGGAQDLGRWLRVKRQIRLRGSQPASYRPRLTVDAAHRSRRADVAEVVELLRSIRTADPRPAG